MFIGDMLAVLTIMLTMLLLIIILCVCMGNDNEDDDNYLYKGFFIRIKDEDRKEREKEEEEREKKLADYYQIYHDYYHKEPYMTNWKPGYEWRYCIPVIKDGKVECEYYIWKDDVVDHSRYQDGIVCKTEEEALEIGKQILSGAKKLKYDKEFFYPRYFSRPWSIPYTIDVGYNSCEYPNSWSCLLYKQEVQP